MQLEIAKVQGNKHYASAESVEAFVRNKTLPAIHDDMGSMMTEIAQDDRRGVLDFGACHGLLSVRAARMGFFPVVGLEADKASVDVYRNHVQQKGVTLVETKIDFLDRSTCERIKRICHSYGITTFLCRRVLPELLADVYKQAGHWPTDGLIETAGRAFAQLALDIGIKHIIVEGRVFSARSVHPVANIDRELAMIGPQWVVKASLRNTRLLVPAA